MRARKNRIMAGGSTIVVRFFMRHGGRADNNNQLVPDGDYQCDQHRPKARSCKPQEIVLLQVDKLKFHN